MTVNDDSHQISLSYGTDDNSFMITDDYSGFGVMIGDKNVGLECDGFGNVLTVAEFKKMNPYNSKNLEVIILRDFVGEINMIYNLSKMVLKHDR